MTKPILTVLFAILLQGTAVAAPPPDEAAKDRFAGPDAPYPLERRLGYGSVFDPAEIKSGGLFVVANQLRRGFVGRNFATSPTYSFHELTYAPEIWHLAALHAAAKEVQWQHAPDTRCQFCDRFLQDLLEWRNIKVIDPIARANEFGHKKFDSLHQACPADRGPDYFIAPAGIMGDSGKSPPAYGSWGFRWYKIPSQNGGTVDLLLYQDAVMAPLFSPEQPQELVRRRVGPFSSFDIRRGEGSGLHGSWFNLAKGCKVQHNALQGYSATPFSLYSQENITREEFDAEMAKLGGRTITLGEMAVIRYQGQAYFLILDLNFNSDPAKSGRTLQLVPVADQDIYPYVVNEVAWNKDPRSKNSHAPKITFTAPLGDTQKYFRNTSH